MSPRVSSVLLALALLGSTAVLPAATDSTASAPTGSGEQGAPTATGSGPLLTSTLVELLSVAASGDGRESRRFVPAEQIRAGDEVHYTIRVRNPGRAPVGSIIVTKRLPFGMHYTRSSAVGPAAEVQFSIDGGESFAVPADLRVRVSGSTARRATVEDYTHVRWLLRTPLAPGATALLRFRATLS